MICHKCQLILMYSIASRIPLGRIEGSVPGRSSGSVGFPQGSLGGRRESPGGFLNQGELEQEIQDEPGVRPHGGSWGSLGESMGGVGGPLGVPGLHWRVPGVAGVPGGPRGYSGRAWEAPKTQKGFSGCL